LDLGKGILEQRRYFKTNRGKEKIQMIKGSADFYFLTAGRVIILALLIVGAGLGISKPKKEILRCRITYYCGDDKWGNQTADPATPRAISGVTVAGHPDFPFGTEIFIPALKGHVGDGHFKVQDRGAWVTSKKAAQGKAYVFDVYVPTKREQDLHAKSRPMYMEVHILRD
jgi:hypothetical protein